MINILILEDDPMVQFIHKSYLEKLAVAGEIFTSQTVDQAQKIIADRPIDLLLLDIHLGQANGLEVLRELRHQNFSGEVILISAATEVHYIQQASHLGILDYLIKPFTFERFAESYQRFTEKKELLTGTQLPQEKIDQLFTPKAAVASPEIFELEKGLTEATLGLIYQQIQQFTDPFTIVELSEIIGLSHVSVRKYIQFLENHGVLKAETIYRKIGRPYQIFSLTTEASPLKNYLKKLADN